MRFNLRDIFLGITVLSVVAGLAVWVTTWRSVTIPKSDITQVKHLVLNTPADPGLGFTLRIRVQGNLNGKAKLLLPWDELELELGPGEFLEEVGYEYYDSEANLTYLPGTVTDGELTVFYDY